jgi:CRP-like cAMP-binding protein
VTTPEIVDLLASSELFRDLPPEALASAAGRSRRHRADRGERLFLEADPADRVGLVLSGRLKLVQLSADGREVILRLVGPGGLFGAVALFEHAAYPASAVVMEDVEVLLWSGDALRGAMLETPQLALNALRLLSARLGRMQDRVRELATERVERRIARAVLRLVRHAGRRTDDGVQIDMPVTRQEIAELTGTTLFTVSRVLSSWEESGLVRTGRQKVVILRPHALVSLAEDLP